MVGSTIGRGGAPSVAVVVPTGGRRQALVGNVQAPSVRGAAPWGMALPLARHRGGTVAAGPGVRHVRRVGVRR
jgi:hypothetical protein